MRRSGLIAGIAISFALIVGCGHPTATVDDELPAELPTTESNSWAHPIESRPVQETAGPTPITGEGEAEPNDSGSGKGTFSGRITFEGDPASSPRVSIEVAWGENFLGVADHDSQGAYRSRSIPEGRYLVRFRPYWYGSPFDAEWYDNAPTKAASRWVYVREGEDTSGIDAHLNLAPPPANDNIARAVSLTRFPFFDTRDTRTATLEPNEPEMAGCDDPNATVWYRLTPTAPTQVTVDTAHPETNDNSQIAAYEGDTYPTTAVGCGSDYVSYDMERSPAPGTRLTFSAEPSKTYWIQVGSSVKWRDNGIGGGTVRVSFAVTTP